MPLTPEWATFFSAELAALAALTGFVVVAISINLSSILAYSWLPARASEALVGPVGAITRRASFSSPSSRRRFWVPKSSWWGL